MSLPTLYEISNQFRELNELALIDDLPPEVLRDTLDALQGDFQAKAVAVVKFSKNRAAVADAIEEAAKQMLDRAARIRKRDIDGLMNYLQFNMQATGISRIECEYFTITLRNNPEAVKIADGATLPEEFMVTPEPPPPKPDKAKLKAALKAGREINGAWLEQGQRIEVKL